jgi:uncharacterized protein
MNILEFSILVGFSSLAAGFLGALTGLGGGIVIVPVLTLLFGVDIRYAIGASLVSVIAASSGAASVYVKGGYTNLRLGMFLEIATTVGALLGAFIAAKVTTSVIAVIFGIVLIYSAIVSNLPRPENLAIEHCDPLGGRLKMDSTYPVPGGLLSYCIHALRFGFGGMFLTGMLSGLLGIGSGAFLVLIMDQVMRIPFKVSTTTSNFMIGVTAAASAGVYLSRGYIDPGLAMPVMLGVLVGSLLGTRVFFKANTTLLRRIFAAVIFVVAAQMIYKGLTGRV